MAKRKSPLSKASPTSDSQLIHLLSQGVSQATRSAKFCVGGAFARVNPEVVVNGLGEIKVPLKPSHAKELISRCRVAPYGKGTETLVDPEVRNSYELDSREFQLGNDWTAAIDDTTRQVAVDLGLPAEQLEARLYKLLIYERGGFFRPHRDSEKYDRMVASLIVVLPNPFDGGKLIVRHGVAEQKFTFEAAAAGQAPCYAAFFADCEHEVTYVSRGRRLCLTYNLVLKPSHMSESEPVAPEDPVDSLVASINSWTAQRPGEPLVFAMDHYYTERGLSQDLLKGADRNLADLLILAADKANCLVHLTQVTRHLQQFADDGSIDRWERRRSRYNPPVKRAIQIGETYSDDLLGAHWTDLAGKKQSWGERALDLTAVVSSIPINDWKPTSQEFEGYTGNAGNTLDRWYHRSAIVLWSREHHFDVIAGTNPADSIPLWTSMLSKLAKTPKKRLDAARTDCIRFARAIIARWPREFGHFGRGRSNREDHLHDFSKQLVRLQDRDTIFAFLLKMAEQDHSLPLHSLIVSSCREFGWTAFASELRQLLSVPPLVQWQQGMRIRDLDWLSAFCVEPTNDADKSALAQELCALAVERFCQTKPKPHHDSWANLRSEPSEAEASLPFLLKALVSSQSDDGLKRVVDFVQSFPGEFNLDVCQHPCLKEIVPWIRKRYGVIPAPLAIWLNSVRQQLESTTAQPPTPPTEWVRPATVKCTCRFCAQLNAFLADPVNEIRRIAAAEHSRQHVISEITRHQCDVRHTLERKGSPFSLVLTKTTGSFERAMKRFEANVKLLAALPSAE